MYSSSSMQCAKEPMRKRHNMVNNFSSKGERCKDYTVSGLPDGFPVSGSQHCISPDLLPLTRCLPSGDHAIQRTQFLCPEMLNFLRFRQFNSSKHKY